MTTPSPQDQLWQAFDTKVDQEDFPDTLGDAFRHVADRPADLATALSTMLYTLGNYQKMVAAHFTRGIFVDALNKLQMQEDAVEVYFSFSERVEGCLRVTQRGIYVELSHYNVRWGDFSTPFKSTSLRHKKPENIDFFNMLTAHFEALEHAAGELAGLIRAQRQRHRDCLVC
ncbi:MAG: hypothetical protein Q4A06_02610 [Cardiobacteriaceae bacterium]|nr:hypothetical protein [Cardiobacteriaceae bacterium]